MKVDIASSPLKKVILAIDSKDLLQRNT